ncbi:GNAT family N-acetyltransferase [Lysinibacillus fusiformis]|uniref:GNAT family N-acetyltransferase n=1 Tax=Lysinibacillus fusiformis TaxID=28031 RepID=UPI001EF47C28|nr:GNAT family N-acetyltransferase [Lysinibacillus fusiformis]MCG7435656.1 GNAT family N-acetyltransferase [Lysinibacillus fusiformis]
MVHTDFQRKGIGTIGMETLLKHCQHENIRWVQLFCAKGKQSFYQKLWFKKRDAKMPLE